MKLDSGVHDPSGPIVGTASHYGVPYLSTASNLPGADRFPALDLNQIHTFPRVAGALDAPAQLGFFERFFLYGLVVACQPQRTLEIGFRYGGSAYLIMCALEDLGLKGTLLSIDPHPEPAVDFSAFGDRFRLLTVRSPGGIAAAVRELGGPVNLCFVDGDHSEQSVSSDLASVLPHMDNESYIVLHDAFYEGVQRAIDRFVRTHRTVIDCGIVARTVNEAGWGGLHLLRVAGRQRSSPVNLRLLQWFRKGSRR